MVNPPAPRVPRAASLFPYAALMDDSYLAEWLKLRLLLGGLAIFVVSGIFSCGELNYLARGRTVAATRTATRTVQHHGRYGTTSQMLQVLYEFPDDNGKVRRETDEVPADYALPTPVMVEYIPNSPDSSRLSGHHQYWALILFLGSFVPIGYSCWKFWCFYKS